MTIDKNDPRLTAFALGELPSEEAAELEAAVEKDPALRAEVDSIRELADKLKATLAEEPLPKTETVQPVEPVKKPSRIRRLAFYGSTVAVVLILIALFTPAGRTAIETARRLVTNNPPQEQPARSQTDLARNNKDAAQVQKELAELVEQFNICMVKQDYEGAEIAAKRAIELDPDNLSAKQLVLNTKFVRKLQNDPSMSDAQKKRFLGQLQSVDSYSVSFDKNAPSVARSVKSDKPSHTPYTIGNPVWDMNTTGNKSAAREPTYTVSKPKFETEGKPGESAQRFRLPKKTTPMSPQVSAADRRQVKVPVRLESADAFAPSPATVPPQNPTGGKQTGLYGLDYDGNSEAGIAPSPAINDIKSKRFGLGVNSEAGVLGSIVLDEKNYGHGRKTKSLTEMVTPRIVIQEEEEKLGVMVPGAMSADLDIPFSSDFSSDGVTLLRHPRPHNTEAYDKITENEFQRVSEHPLSTFSIDVDTASYSMMRRMLTQGCMPVPGAVRLEELINYFDYAYEPPRDGKPFATHVDAAKCPWNEKHSLVRIGLKGRVIEKTERDPANLVFLLDVSGSMGRPNKLPLLKDAMKMLVENLNENDRVAIVVYAGASGMVLPSTKCGDKQKILESLSRLKSGGSTNGGAGIKLAYATAAANHIDGGVNRVILCTDGDFNVGTTNQSELVSMIEKKAKEGVFLTVLGFGMGNYKDSTLEKLADKGNGNYGYIDTINEARKLLVEGLSGTLVTIAKDVKIQVEFNPHHVKGYRLLGYENRMLRKEDFNDDTKDAGEIGAGHTVTALYEIIPADSAEKIGKPTVDEFKYQKAVEKTDDARSDEMLTVKIRYKEPDGQKSKLLSFPVKNEIVEFDNANVDLKFASSVAAFGMILRDSQFKGDADYDKVIRWVKSSLGEDEFDYREEFLKLVRMAKSLSNK